MMILFLALFTVLLVAAGTPIAFAMGFSSPSSFTYAFRRAVGTSPSNFRKRQLRADFAA